jgi:hypothetical protein
MILENERLRVEIADLGKVYGGARFDWTGFITQVTLDGKHSYCVPESLKAGEGTGGIGLCNEFGIFRPIGYDDARPGEKFPKLGVGLLTRPDAGPHDFAAPYAIEPFPMRMTGGADRVVYEVDPLPCRGYEARLRKTIQLAGAGFDVVYELENVGRWPIRTHEYNHNFVAIDGRPPGPGYSLRLPKGIVPIAVTPPLTLEGRDVLWSAGVTSPFLNPAPGPYPHVEGAFWELTRQPGGVGLREIVNFPPEHFAIWCTPHLIGPEVFIAINLKAGGRMSWTRRYEFFSGGFDKKP